MAEEAEETAAVEDPLREHMPSVAQFLEHGLPDEPELLQGVLAEIFPVDSQPSDGDASASVGALQRASCSARAFGASITTWKSGLQEAYRTKKEETLEATRGLVHEAMPQKLREWHHKSKSLMLDVKEQYQERRQDFVQRVVNGLEVADTPKPYKPPEPKAAELTQRWWTGACSAVHQPHSLADDPPRPPEKAFFHSDDAVPDNAMAEGSDAGPARLRPALGCLEVELLHFSEAPPLTRSDGSPAISPVCQISLRGCCTGALRPRRAAGASASSNSVSSGCGSGASSSEVGLGGEAQAPALDSSELGGQERDLEQAAHVARFAVDEIAGCDLRVHVFDSDSKRFSIGLEDRAFCGGAFVPLSSLARHHAGPLGCLGGLFCETVETELAVTLLPLEAIRMAKKLQRAEVTGLERPAKAGLGHVLLRARLTVYDRTPAWAYVSIPYRGEFLEALPDSNQLQPITVLKTVAKALERVSRALNPRVFAEALDQLRERAVTDVFLYMLWTYAVLWAPFWKVPGCAAVALTILGVQVTLVSKESEDPLRLFKDELCSDEALTRMEGMKKNMKNAAKMELHMMQLAATLTRVAIVAEKVRYVLTWQDMQLSGFLGLILCGATLVATLVLRILLCIFGRHLFPVAAWLCGCLLLLPAAGRGRALALAQQVHAARVRRLGRGRPKEMLEALWRRIPDSLEAQHRELAGGYVLAVCR